MKYIKPELKFDIIQPKQFIASGIAEWIEKEEMSDAKITIFYVAES